MEFDIFTIYALVLALVVGYLARMLMNDAFVKAKLKNALKKDGKWGIAFLLFRNGQHEERVVNQGLPQFEARNLTFLIDSSKAGRIHGLPCLVYLEDDAMPKTIRDPVTGQDKVINVVEPTDMSIERVSVSNPAELQAHLRLAAYLMMAEKSREIEKLMKMILWIAGAAALLSLLSLVFAFNAGNSANAVGEVCRQSLNVSTEILGKWGGGPVVG